MTREEAIAFFKDMNECTYGNLEAVEMAIKALEQTELADGDRAISLNAVMTILASRSIDETYIGEQIRQLPSVKPQEPTGHCEDCKHFRKLPLRTDTSIGKCIQHWGVCPPCDWYCADFEPQESEG